jgi:hypothetical protein
MPVSFKGYTDNGLPQIHKAQSGFIKEMLAAALLGFCLFYPVTAGAAIPVGEPAGILKSDN